MKVELWTDYEGLCKLAANEYCTAWSDNRKSAGDYKILVNLECIGKETRPGIVQVYRRAE